jgi:alkylhydroperoxidase family enzyme
VFPASWFTGAKLAPDKRDGSLNFFGARPDFHHDTQRTPMADPTSSPSRLGGAAEAPDDPVLAEMFARIRASRGHLLNIHRVAGLAPKLLRAQATYARAMRDEASLTRDFQELIILRIAQVNDSDYEQSVHRPIALACGAPQQRSTRLRRGRSRRCTTRGSEPRSATSTRPHAAAMSTMRFLPRSGRTSRRRKSSS